MQRELWPDGPLFDEGFGKFTVGADSVLLSHYAASGSRSAKRAADLGCGSGLISILLAMKNQNLFIDAVEINNSCADLAENNAVLCGLAARINVIRGDLRLHRDLFGAGLYDLVVSNPPYFKQGVGKISENFDLVAARTEISCTLSDICSAASYLTRWGGAFTFVHKPERLPEICCTLSSFALEPKRMKFVAHNIASPPSLVLIECKKGGKPSLTVEAPLILKNDDGSDSVQAMEYYCPTKTLEDNG